MNKEYIVRKSSTITLNITDGKVDSFREIDESNRTVRVYEDGKIGVSEATCPDHYCMKRGFCDSGTEIVCLPNRMTIRFLGQQEIDAVIG